MGIYTSNRYFGGNVYDYAAEIPANEAYDAAFGCAHILADCTANDMALFESAIYDDINEVMSIHEGYEAINENAFTDIVKKIIEMFKKLLAKIKGIFNAFLAKLSGAFKNGKDLVKKYEKQIVKYSNWKDLKIKGVRRPKGKGTSIMGAVDTLFAMHISNDYNIPSTDTTDWALDTKILGKTAKEIDDMDTDDLKLHIIKEGEFVKGITLSDMKDLSEEISNHLYDEEDTVDGDDDKISSSFFTADWIKGVLVADKWQKDVEKKNKNCTDKISKIIDDLKKIDDKLAKEIIDKNIGDSDRIRLKSGSIDGFNLADSSKTIGKDDKAQNSYKDFEISTNTYNKLKNSNSFKAGIDADNKETLDNTKKYKGSTYPDIQKYIHALQKVASNEQEVITKVTSEYMAQVKFAMAQARKMWTAAAAWSSTTHKESVEYYQALGEAAAEQFYMNMESL